MRPSLTICCVGILLAGAAPVHAHSGGLDKYGCHAGSQPYHCHNGDGDGSGGGGEELLIALAAAGIVWYAVDSHKKRRAGIQTKIARSPALQRYDDNRNGRISCREARRHGIAPVKREHPAYRFMRDRDNDGEVCEGRKRSNKRRKEHETDIARAR